MLDRLLAEAWRRVEADGKRWDLRQAGPEVRITREIGIHPSTVGNHLQAILLGRRTCPTCHLLWPKDGRWEEDITTTTMPNAAR